VEAVSEWPFREPSSAEVGSMIKALLENSNRNKSPETDSYLDLAGSNYEAQRGASGYALSLDPCASAAE